MAGTKSSIRIPSYRLHKATGQAVVTFQGKDHYLGQHGTAESRLKYERLIISWMQAPGEAPQMEPKPGDDLTVAELAAMYFKWAATYYVKAGQKTTEMTNVKRAIRALREAYATLPARDFSPLKLKAVRERLVDDGLCRMTSNRHVRCVVRIFRWATENELVPADVWNSLRAVKPLAKGRCEAPERPPVLPVPDDVVEATLGHLDAQTAAMVKVQLLLACRPGELCSMTAGDIDQSGDVWIYRPQSHKCQHHDKDRIIPIGPRAQLLLRAWLPAFPAIPLWRNQRGRPISPACYATRIRVACVRTGIPGWHPNQLRHAGATKIRSQAGLDAAQVVLGHASVATTQIYAEKNLDSAIRIAAEVG
jgi:integrase